MKKLRLFALLCALTLALTSCGASSSRSYAAADTTETVTASDYSYYTEETAESEEIAEDAETSSTTARQSDAKLIYTGSLELETTDMTAAIAGLEAMVDACGGYVESQEVYHRSSWQYAYYTVRIPSEQYDAFMSGASDWEGCAVTYQSTNVEDVGETYADIEDRLETLEIKLDRLQELMGQAESMEDIITIESSISDVESEIESLTGQKDRYDSLIDYSTIYVTLDQVSTLGEGVDPTLGERLSAGLRNGIQGFADGCVDLLVWLVSNLIGVLIFLAVAVLVIVLLVRRRRRRRREKAAELPEPPEES